MKLKKSKRPWLNSVMKGDGGHSLTTRTKEDLPFRGWIHHPRSTLSPSTFFLAQHTRFTHKKIQIFLFSRYFKYWCKWLRSPIEKLSNDRKRVVTDRRLAEPDCNKERKKGKIKALRRDKLWTGCGKIWNKKNERQIWVARNLPRLGLCPLCRWHTTVQESKKVHWIRTRSPEPRKGTSLTFLQFSKIAFSRY